MTTTTATIESSPLNDYVARSYMSQDGRVFDHVEIVGAQIVLKKPSEESSTITVTASALDDFIDYLTCQVKCAERDQQWKRRGQCQRALFKLRIIRHQQTATKVVK